MDRQKTLLIAGEQKIKLLTAERKTKMTWYKVDQYFSNYEPIIQTVNVERYTDSSIWLINENGKQGMQRRSSDWHNYFPTFAEAKKFASDRANKEAQDLRKRLEKKEAEIKAIEEMQEPQ